MSSQLSLVTSSSVSSSRPPQSLWMVTAAMKLKTVTSWQESYDKPRLYLKANTLPNQQRSFSLSSSHVWIWTLDNKEGRAPKNWCFQIVMTKNLESPLESKEVKQDNFKGNQPWIFIGRTNAEALILWPPDANSWLAGKDPDARNDWRQKRATEDETFGRHHRSNGRELGHTPGDCEGQGSLVCCSAQGHEELRHNLVTEQLVRPQVWSYQCSVENRSHFLHKRKGDIGFINCFSFKAKSLKPKLRQYQISVWHP